ncbi:MAG: tRNA glutamyl-Q(34) synthetase GluQRS [Proteobacteria bacterium]|nr:tRNA glutamyl-Q(34) synthetase GluQRS [Pseudomonadota bacterium]
MPYVGRFAPSPTGLLHLGSLTAALGSYLEARSRGGRWLVRMEDLDLARVRPGCADRILRTLTGFGLHWDGEVVYQSRRTGHYLDALRQLQGQGLTYRCTCSRREQQVAPGASGAYPGTCRDGSPRPGPAAMRFRLAPQPLTFEDRLQGLQRHAPQALGDFIVQRRDGIAAYQLAVVVDDALQSVNDVVRGADLLASTPWQIAVQRALGLPRPGYAHLPLLTEPGGRKLAKSRRSLAIDPARASVELHAALVLLRQQPPGELRHAPVAQILDWARDHWAPARLAGIAELPAPLVFTPAHEL